MFDAAIYVEDDTAVGFPDTLVMTPGPTGAIPMLRWIAPASALYTVAVQWFGAHMNNTYGFVLVNGLDIHNVTNTTVDLLYVFQSRVAHAKYDVVAD